LNHWVLSKEDCSDAVSRFLANSGIDPDSNPARILVYLVTETNEGRENLIKGFSIGHDVMGKDARFDPSNDSSVRVEMKRLRERLVHYYSTAGSADPVQINIPRRRSIRSGLSRFALAAVVLISVGLVAINSAVVKPITPHAITVQISDIDGPDETAALVRSALKAALVPGVTIALVDPSDPSIAAAEANFLVSARIAKLREGHLLSIGLNEAKSHRIFWVKNVKIPEDAELYDVVEHQVGSELRIRLFGASKELLKDVEPEKLDADALFVLATWVPGVATNAIAWEKSRIAMAQLALEKSPDFGAAHSVLADKLAYLANVYSGVDGAAYMDAAKGHARRALETAPLDPDVIFNVAQARFLAMVIPYTCGPAPDFVMRAATAFDAKLSPNNPIRWLTLTWISWLHTFRDELDLALLFEERASLIFEIPYSFMRHAMILDQLGRPDDASRVFHRQRENWEDFDPLHFAEQTIPRLCGDSPVTAQFIQMYSDLARTLTAER